MRTKLLILLAALAAPLATPAARADDLRPFCADRPGKATPPCILDAGRVQLETSLADGVLQRARDAHEDILTLGASEARLGLTRRLEAEAAWAPWIIERPKGAPEVRGAGDATFGLRWSLTDPDAQDAIAVSAQGYVNAPTATHHLGEGGWSGGFRMPIASPLPDGFILGLAPQVDVVRDPTRRGTHAAESAGLSIGRGFGDNTFGVELWGQNDGAPHHVTRQASFDLTAARLMGKDSQIDAGANFGLNRATPTTEIYIGIARRF